MNTWELYDLLVPLVSRVVVADPTQVKVIAASFVKTDKRDTLALARLRASNLIPEVWVPPMEVRELRSHIAHRQRRALAMCDGEESAARASCTAIIWHPQPSIRLGLSTGCGGRPETWLQLSACGCTRIWR